MHQWKQLGIGVVVGLGLLGMPPVNAFDTVSIECVVSTELSPADANFERGILYYSGEGAMRKSYKKARAAFEEAADAGNPNAQLMLGHMLTDGKGGDKDVDQGLWWIQKAAEQGLINAQFALGLELHGMKKNPKKQASSFYWTDRAASSGHVRAHTLLGMLYTEGTGTPIDYKKAKVAFEYAAKHGEPLAQLKVGLMYKLGLGTPQQYSMAYAWLSLAEKNGQSKATPFIEEIRGEMRHLVQEDADRQLKALQVDIAKTIKASATGRPAR
jgi:uncharacterized protein